MSCLVSVIGFGARAPPKVGYEQEGITCYMPSKYDQKWRQTLSPSPVSVGLWRICLYWTHTHIPCPYIALTTHTHTLITHTFPPLPQVLELLSSLCKDESTKAEIKPYGSQAVQASLSSPPYRVLQPHSNAAVSSLDDSSQETKSFDVVVFCLPTTADYLKPWTSGFLGSRAARRMCAPSSASLVLCYDPKADAFAGDIVASGVAESFRTAAGRRPYNAAALLSLSSLDVAAASQLSSGVKPATVIVVGGGGREHALCVALAASPLVGRVIAAPGNGGTAVEGGKVSNAGGEHAGRQDNAAVLELVELHGADMVVVGPEQPLVDGLVDELREAKPQVRAFGPTKAAATLEASKAFTKDFLKHCGIRTAAYENFTAVDEALEYVRSLPEGRRVVVKASGLAAGKGVLLPETREEAEAAVKEIMSNKVRGGGE